MHEMVEIAPVYWASRRHPGGVIALPWPLSSLHQQICDLAFWACFLPLAYMKPPSYPVVYSTREAFGSFTITNLVFRMAIGFI
jgi:hypothetical protein